MKSGTPGAGSGAEAEAKNWAGAVAGKVHATIVVAKKDRWFWGVGEAAVAGSLSVSGVAVATQQSICVQSPQAQSALARTAAAGADAIA